MDRGLDISGGKPFRCGAGALSRNLCDVKFQDLKIIKIELNC